MERSGGRFATPPFPESRRPRRCSRFERCTSGNSLVSLLANSAAEVAYFNRQGLGHRLIVKGKYVKATDGLSRDSGALVKVVIADSRLTLLESKPGEYIHRTRGIRFTRIDKYERSDIAAGTLIVFVSLSDPFPLDRTRTVKLKLGNFRVPRVLATNLRRAYSTLANCHEYVVKLVEYPITDGPPDQDCYLHDLWKVDNIAKIFRQILLGADVYDTVVLKNVFGILGARVNVFLDESLSSIARRLEFTRVQKN